MRTTAVLTAMSLSLALLLPGCSRDSTGESVEMRQAREAMVLRLSQQWGVKDKRVLAAVSRVPRQGFLPENMRPHSYTDNCLLLGGGQALCSPVLIARALEELNPQTKHNVLMVNIDSAYPAAVASHMSKRVYVIVMTNTKQAIIAQQVATLGLSNVEVRACDTAQGYGAGAPYKCVMLNSASMRIPDRIVEQSDPDGVIVQFAEPYATDLRVTHLVDREPSRAKVVSLTGGR